MPPITGADTTNLGTVQVGGLRNTRNWYPHPLLALGASIEILEQGGTSHRALSLDEFSAAGLVADGAEVESSALPSIDADSATPIGFGIAYEPTSDALNNTLEMDKLLKMLDVNAVKAVLDALSHGASGLVQQTANLTITGTSGTALSFSKLRTGRRGMHDSVGSANVAMVITDRNGMDQLAADKASSGASMNANIALAPQIEALIVKGAIPDNIGYTGCAEEGMYFFIVNRGSSQLYTSGGDSHAIILVPPEMDGKLADIQTAFHLTMRANPIIARTTLLRNGDAKVSKAMGKIPIGRYVVDMGRSSAKIVYETRGVAYLANAIAARAVRYQ